MYSGEEQESVICIIGTKIQKISLYDLKNIYI